MKRKFLILESESDFKQLPLRKTYELSFIAYRRPSGYYYIAKSRYTKNDKLATPRQLIDILNEHYSDEEKIYPHQEEIISLCLEPAKPVEKDSFDQTCQKLWIDAFKEGGLNHADVVVDYFRKKFGKSK
jgi:hypothetical protein